MNSLAPQAGLDLTEPVEIMADSYWVGRREGVLLERNIYLRVFSRGGKKVNLIIDPGPPEDLLGLSQKVGKVVGNLRNVNLVFLNHQDPDVGYNSGYLQKLNPNLWVLCSEDTWRLVKFYGLNPKAYKPVDKFRNLSATLSTGHRISFVLTPFCHFRGAAMLYDPETRILYTGDLFGGLSYRPDLFADESAWEGMKTFHQIYMPVQEALQLAVRNIRRLDPPPLVLAPQHGSIIAGEWVEHYLARLEKLPVGLNLLMESFQKENYLVGMNELLSELTPYVKDSLLREALQVFQEDGSFPDAVRTDGLKVLDVRIDLPTAIDIFIRVLMEKLPESRDLVEMAAVKVLLGRNIPLPEHFRGETSERPELFEE